VWGWHEVILPQQT